MGAVTALAGTAAVIWVTEFAVKLADNAPNCTPVAAPRLFPVTTTASPTTPLDGVKLEIVGLPSPTSTVTFTAAETAEAFSLSVALAVITCTPLAEGVQENW